jgi:Zn ribbon nucleic-acid-binding protein
VRNILVSVLGKKEKLPLSVTHPELAKEAHGWDPTKFLAGSNKKMSWRCSKNHTWDSLIISRALNGAGCPYCSGNKVLAGFNDLAALFPSIAKEAFGWDPSLVTSRSNQVREWKCEKGHHWKTSIANRTQGKTTGCAFCSNRKILIGYNDLKTLNAELAQEAFGWNPSKILAVSSRKLTWRCQKKHTWNASVQSRFLRNSKCPKCSNREIEAGFNDLATTHPQIAVEALGWDPTTLSFGNGKILNWLCPLGHQYRTSVNARVRGNNCPICSNHTVLKEFNDLATTHPQIASEAYGWDPATVIAGSDKIRAWKCKNGHIYSTKISSKLKNKVSCPYCLNRKLLKGFNDLNSTHPEIASEAYQWDPSELLFSSRTKRSWICNRKHIYEATIISRTHMKSGCAYCANKKVLPGFNDIATTRPDLAKEAKGWDPTQFIARSNKILTWECAVGHFWKASPANRNALNNPTGCPTCSLTGFDPNKDALIYLLYHPDWQMLKIGITNSPDRRLGKHMNSNWEVIETRGPMKGHLARSWEYSILLMLKAKGADLSNSKIAGKFDGYSEAWSKSTFEVKSIKALMRLTEEFEAG